MGQSRRVFKDCTGKNMIIQFVGFLYFYSYIDCRICAEAKARGWVFFIEYDIERAACEQI